LTVLSLLFLWSPLISSLFLFVPRRMVPGISTTTSSAAYLFESATSIGSAFFARVDLPFPFPAFLLAIDTVESNVSCDILLTSIESLRSGMLCAWEAFVTLDCVDSLDAFETLAFLPRPALGAVFPAKTKKAQCGERR